MMWTPARPVPTREPALTPAYRRDGDRVDFWLRFSDGSVMILGLDSHWGDPALLEARPQVVLNRPNGTRAGGLPVSQRAFPPGCQQAHPYDATSAQPACRILDQEPRPDGGRNVRYESLPPFAQPDGWVEAESGNLSVMVGDYDTARSFTLEVVDGFPVARPRSAEFGGAAAEMFLCLRSCASRMMISRLGTDGCASRVATEPNSETVSNICVGDWHVYFDGRADEIRVALTFREPTAADASPP
jgi:hypothetical protein